MHKRKKRQKKTPKTPAKKLPAQLIPTDPFSKDLRRCSREDFQSIMQTLTESLESLFSRRKLKPLITYKGKKLWYFEAGDDIRIVAWRDANSNLYLLSIEDHDSLSRAHKSGVARVKSIKNK